MSPAMFTEGVCSPICVGVYEGIRDGRIASLLLRDLTTEDQEFDWTVTGLLLASLVLYSQVRSWDLYWGECYSLGGGVSFLSFTIRLDPVKPS